MKRYILTFLLAPLIPVSAAGADDKRSAFGGWTMTKSQYAELFTGFEVHDRPVQHFYINKPLFSGLSAGVWGSLGLNDADLSSDRGDELNYELNWGFEPAVFDAVFSATYYDIVYLVSNSVEDSYGTRLRVSKNLGYAGFIIEPFAWFETIFKVNGGGDYSKFLAGGFSMSKPLSGTSRFGGKVEAVRYDLSSGKLGIVVHLDADLSWKLTDRIWLKLPWVRYTFQAYQNSLCEDTGSKITWGTGLTF